MTRATISRLPDSLPLTIAPGHCFLLIFGAIGAKLSTQFWHPGKLYHGILNWGAGRALTLTLRFLCLLTQPPAWLNVQHQNREEELNGFYKECRLPARQKAQSVSK